MEDDILQQKKYEAFINGIRRDALPQDAPEELKSFYDEGKKFDAWYQRSTGNINIAKLCVEMIDNAGSQDKKEIEAMFETACSHVVADLLSMQFCGLKIHGDSRLRYRNSPEAKRAKSLYTELSRVSDRFEQKMKRYEFKHDVFKA